MKTLHILLFLLIPCVFAHAQWTKLTNYPDVSVSDLISVNGVLYASNDGISPRGVYKSVNGGADWTDVSPSVPAGKRVHDLLVTSTGLWAATLDGIYYSSNSGAEWTKKSVGLPNAVDWDFIWAYGINEINGVLYASIDRGIYRSTNNGDSWTVSHYGGMDFHCRDVTGFNNYILAAKYMSGTSGFGALYRSSNNGSNWSNAYYYQGQQSVSSFTLYNDGTRLYSGTTDGVFMTTDGVNWVDRNNGLTFDTHVNSIVRKGGTLLASENESGVVFRSSNDGQAWIPVHDTLEIFSDINRLVVEGNILYAATEMGIYKIPVDAMVLTAVQTVSTETPGSFTLRQNYPNPFNPATHIEYSVPVKGMVNITVHDITGREVATLINTVQSPGVYSVSFDGSKLTSGVYFYRLTAESFTETKKMLLLK